MVAMSWMAAATKIQMPQPEVKKPHGAVSILRSLRRANRHAMYLDLVVIQISHGVVSPLDSDNRL